MAWIAVAVLVLVVLGLVWALWSKATQLAVAQARTDEVRRQVERDLHDSAQQRLVLTMLKLGVLAKRAEGHQEAVTDIRSELEQALSEMRAIARGLSPALLQEQGLVPALTEVAGRAAVETTVHAESVGRYSREIEAEIYFCCAEALQNAAKHAGENARASLRLRQRDGKLTFEVSDDGLGFDPAQAPMGSGLTNMRERIKAVGGCLTVTSEPGRGTRVVGGVAI